MNEDHNAVWQFDREVEALRPSGRGMSSVHTFIYENDSVIINLPSKSKSPGVVLPDDNIYRIKTKWKGNELYIFPPLGGKWELFAAWENDRFVMYGNGKMKIFKKIKPEEIAAWQKDLLKAGREMWDYRHLDPDEIEI
jgi:hypothetical protein